MLAGCRPRYFFFDEAFGVAVGVGVALEAAAAALCCLAWSSWDLRFPRRSLSLSASAFFDARSPVRVLPAWYASTARFAKVADVGRACVMTSCASTAFCGW